MGCLFRFGGGKKELFGFDPHTTNNRRELKAAIQGLLALKRALRSGDHDRLRIPAAGIIKWKRRHWWRKHDPVRNADLWIELDELNAIH